MAAQLGIGVRVMVGWTTADRITSTADPRLQRGVIFYGPTNVADGAMWKSWPLQGGRYWGVALDEGSHHFTHERMLTPIDDGDPDAERVDDELEVVA